MEKEQEATQNIIVPNKNLDILKQHFSHCFDKDGDFNFEKFKTELSEKEVNFSKESYTMDWLGKSYARLLASDEATTLLREDEKFNQQPENINSKNLLLKGDNLEILKHLSNAYYEKVKMIYIDPPYNTGSDGFVYQDDRKFTIREFQNLSGVSAEKAKRILDFVDSKSNSHSAWLTFMYPRLYIAKQLLKEDGVIFISIDDNEVAQLRLMMDEIFGEENFVECLTWNKRIPKNDKGIGSIHEYILIYLKQSKLDYEFIVEKEGLADIYKLLNKLKKRKVNLPEAEKEIKKLYNKKGYDRGITLYNSLDENYNLLGKINMSWPNASTFGPRYEVLHPSTKKPVNIPDRGWRWKKSTFEEAAKIENGKYTEVINLHDGSFLCGRIWFGLSENMQPSSIKYLSEVETYLLRSIISLKSDGGIEIEKFFNKKSYFPYPKPTSLLKILINSILVDSTEIILDFFAGSGTTGDAVMQLNAKDGGKRQYILVQLPEQIDKKKSKAAYDFVKNELEIDEPTIFEITKERLIRAAKKIVKDKETNQDLFSEDADLDLGFKVFETMPIWEDYRIEAEAFNPQMSLFDETQLTESDVKMLLTTWKTYDGILLTEALETVDLDGYEAHYFEDKLYLMDKGFEIKNLKLLIEKIDSDKGFNPSSIVAFGYHFDSKNLREISENVKSYVNKKKIDIDFVIRY